jgi:hypothetical protein
MSNNEPELSKVEIYRFRIDKAEGFSEVWEIVKESVKNCLGKHKGGMMLFLDDLPLQMAPIIRCARIT